MPNYRNGKVYAIRSRSRPDLVYVGSTTVSLSVRMGKHRNPSNGCRSKQVVDVGDSYIELIEACPCASKEQLLKKEGEIMRSMECVNNNIPGRTAVEYYADNCVEIKEYNKKYRADNCAKIKEYRKEYHVDNRAEMNEKSKKYNADNKDKIKKKQSERIVCACGAVIRRDCKARHMRTNKHIYDFIHS